VVKRAATADPVNLPLPALPANPAAVVNYNGSGTLTLSPGAYQGIINSGTGTIMLSPGVYFIENNGIQDTGKGSITGSGVLIFNAGGVQATGGGSITLTAPAPGSLPSAYTAYAGIALFQVAQPGANAAPISASNNSTISVDGKLYAPGSAININGGTVTDYTDSNWPLAQVIVADVNVQNGALVVDAIAPALIPPSNTPNPGATPVSISSFGSSVSASVPTQPVTLTATLSPAAATGTVDFFDTTTHVDLGSATVSGGVAALTTSALTSLGSHVISATYIAGSPNFAPPGAPATLTQVGQSEAIEGKTLFVGGTSTFNNILLTQSGTNVVVNLNNGQTNYQTPLSGLTGLVVYDQGGAAKIQVASQITLPTVLYAGSGVGDQLTGGGGPTVEVGGVGGLATLKGGSGRNILIAGAGGANLQGSSAGSILIGGNTNYDANLAVLEAALLEWNSSDSYTTRLTKLGTTFNASTVNRDGQADHLQGGGGNQALDWFFASSLDKINGSNANDKIVTIQ
jgi:hypothetical protein